MDYLFISYRINFRKVTSFSQIHDIPILINELVYNLKI